MEQKSAIYVNSGAGDVRFEPSAMIITERKDGPPITIKRGDVTGADWFVLGQLGTLHLTTKSNRFYSVAGFRSSDQDQILESVTRSIGFRPTVSHGLIRGSNHGELSFQDRSFSISADGFPLLSIPYLKINQGQPTSTNDLVLNFRRDPDGECISSLRLFVPDRAPKDAKELMELLRSRTDLSGGTQEYFCILNEVSFVHPRQRFNVRFCQDLLFLYNQSAAHRVPYDAISMVHRLEDPTPGESQAREEYIVISLREQIRQGQSNYTHLVIKTADDDPVEGEGIESKWPLAVQLEQLFNRVSVRNVPTTGFFEGLQGEHGIHCTFKGKQGLLYLTADAFLYLYSPVVYIPYQNVVVVQFDRVTSESSRHSRAFDLTIQERNRKSTFANVDLIAGIPIVTPARGNEHEFIESMKKEKSAVGLKALIAFMEKVNVRIDGLKKLKKSISALEQGSVTGKRASRIDAERKTRDELKGLGSDSNESESDHDFNPDAAEKADASADESEDAEGEEEEADADDDDND
jgi:hypothetical protein